MKQHISTAALLLAQWVLSILCIFYQFRNYYYAYFCSFIWQTKNIIILFFDATFQRVTITVHCAGPDKWADNYPVANGPRQSPIDIVSKAAVFDSDLKPLKLSYDPANAAGILNNGHSFQVDFLDDIDSSSKIAVLALSLLILVVVAVV